MKLVGGIAMLSVAATIAAGGQVFRSGVEGITVVASVRQGNKPVGGLTAADFQLTDNGVPQQISSVAAEKVPLDLTLLLDLSSSVDGPQLERLKKAVTDTADLLRPDDRIRLVAISQVLHEVFGFRSRSSPIVLDTLRAEGATSLYDGLAAMMMRPADPGRRQLVVAFTDGRDSTSIVDEKTTLEIARRSDSVVSIVVPVAAEDAAVSRRLAQRNTVDSLSGAGNVSVGRGQLIGPDGIPTSLTQLVAPTGGLVIPLGAGESISRVFKTTLDDFRASYVLQYTADGVAADGWHELSVVVKRRGRYDIRARKGYMGRGRIGSPEAFLDTHSGTRLVWPRAVPGTADVQVDDGARRSGRHLPRQER
jgi:VWFA-related protein